MKTVRVVIKGRVQGVGFRWFAVDAARRLGITGWVRNTPEGHVEAEAQGADEDLERFVELLKRGPRPAHVSSLQVNFTEREAYHGFDVRY